MRKYRRLRSNPPRRKVDWRWVKAETEEQGLTNLFSTAAQSEEDPDTDSPFNYAQIAYGYFSLQNYTREDREKIIKQAVKIVLPSLYAFGISWDVRFTATNDKKFLHVPVAWASSFQGDEMEQVWTLYNAGMQSLGAILDYYEEVDATTKRGQNLEFEEGPQGNRFDPVVRQLDLTEELQRYDVRQRIGPLTLEEGPYEGLEILAAGIEESSPEQIVDEIERSGGGFGDIRVVTRPTGTLFGVLKSVNPGIDPTLTWVVAINPYMLDWKKYPATATLLNIYEGTDEESVILPPDLRDNPKRKRRR